MIISHSKQDEANAIRFKGSDAHIMFKYFDEIRKNKSNRRATKWFWKFFFIEIYYWIESIEFERHCLDFKIAHICNKFE